MADNKSTGDAQRLLSEAAAADFLAVSPRTLRNWRSRGGGPRYVRVSARCIRYRMADLIEWAEERTKRNTSDLGLSPIEI